jgi:hypothetical protein
MRILTDIELKSGYKKMVHVEGWNIGCCFHIVGIEDGVKKLITPKTRKIVYTKNNLLTTIGNS